MGSLSKKARLELKQMFGGKCAYCGCELGDRWHADHIEPVIRQYEVVRINKPNQTYAFRATGNVFRPENDRADNFYPSCIPCNIHKSTCSVETFRRVLEGHIETLNTSTNQSIYRHAKRFGLVAETGRKVVFWFEQFKKEAA